MPEHNDELISRIMSGEHIREILRDIHGEPPPVAVAFDAVDEPPPEEAAA